MVHSRSTLAGVLALVAAAALLACSGGSTSIPSAGGSGTNAGADAGSADGEETQATPGRPAWQYGSSTDEEAYCELFAQAEAVVECENSPELETSRLATCTKQTPCYRTIYEPDFLERQRKCLEEKLACSRPDTDACSELAGKTYSAGASFVATCEQRKTSCKQDGAKLDLGCKSLGGLTDAARAKAEACFAESNACVAIVPCMLAAFGGACAKL